jgi:hypothetical protein
VAVQQAVVLLRNEFPLATFIYEYPTLCLTGKQLRADIAVFDEGKRLLAVVEVGDLSGGPDRLVCFADAWPEVRVLWIPHCDLYPVHDRFRLKGRVDYAHVVKTVNDETIAALRADNKKLRRRIEDALTQRDDWKNRVKNANQFANQPR